MTPSEWLRDAVLHLAGWEAQHAQLDRDRAALPSDAERDVMRATGQRGVADQLDAAERGMADAMRDLDAQVRRTVADVSATVPAMTDADRAQARKLLTPLAAELGRARWALSLLEGPRAARSGLRAARAAGKVLPIWLLMVALAAVARGR